MIEIYRMTLELDEDDRNAINMAITQRQIWRVLPDGDGNLAGRVLAEICRGWMELHDNLPDSEGEEWKRGASE